MHSINSDLFNQLKNLLILGYSYNELLTYFSVDNKHLNNMLEGLKNDIIESSNEFDFYIIKIINIFINNKDLTKDETKILSSFIENTDRVNMCKNNKISNIEYLKILKSIYAHLIIYEKDACLTIKVKNEINKLEEIGSKAQSLNRKKIYKSDDKATFDIGKNALKVMKNNRKFNKELSGDTESKKHRKINPPRAKICDRVIESSARSIEVKDIGEHNNLRLLVIADTHYGHINENTTFVQQVYEYASKYNINMIIHAGDVIEGDVDGFLSCKSEYSTILSQIGHVFKDYPYDENIRNYILLGNHDASFLINDGVDLYDELGDRSDFELLGYRNAFIKVGNEYIFVKHSIPRMTNPFKEEEVFLNFYGHAHLFELYHNANMASAKVPALSLVKTSGTLSKGFLDVELTFDSGYATSISINYIPVKEEEKEGYIRILK